MLSTRRRKEDKLAIKVDIDLVKLLFLLEKKNQIF